MEKIIVTSPEELEALIESSVKRVLKVQNGNNTSRDPEHFTVKQAAAYLDLAEQTIYGLTSRNEIPHYKRGKKLYFLKAELEKWMLENRKPQLPKPSVFRKTNK
ncbi:MAG: helix-turn-helix domain-containing protein [Chitinophagales bacterium]